MEPNSLHSKITDKMIVLSRSNYNTNIFHFVLFPSCSHYTTFSAPTCYLVLSLNLGGLLLDYIFS